jgi:hypothetical protein
MTLRDKQKPKSSSLRGALATKQSSSFFFAFWLATTGQRNIAPANLAFPIDQFDQSGLGALAGFV